MTEATTLTVTPPWATQPVDLPVTPLTGTWWISTGLDTEPHPPAGEHGRDHRWGFATTPATRVAHPSIAAAWDAAAAWFTEQTRTVRIRRVFTQVELVDAPVVDLTDPTTQELVGITQEALTAYDPSACQYLGEVLWLAGATALKVPTPTDNRVALLLVKDAPGASISGEPIVEFSPVGWPVVPDGNNPSTPGSSFLQVVTATQQ